MWSETQKRYYQSSKGRLARQKYQSSDKAKETHRLYRLTRKARLAETKQIKDTAPVENQVEDVKVVKEPTT